jgi:malonyl-CoA O-methyltransferase
MLRGDFAQAAASYDGAAVLARETGRRMAERLDYVKLEPGVVADIGCATGDGIRELQRRYPRALPLALDYALPMLHAARARTPRVQRMLGRGPRWVNADARALPLASNSLGLAWSNLMLHWLDDPLSAFKEVQRVLAVGGLFMFATLGPDTLKELRGAGATDLPAFPDMHDLGDQLLAAGFADPVMDMEMLALTYRHPHHFLRDQRHLGVRDGLLGHLGWRQWRQVFSRWPRKEGLLPARFEIVYGHAWKGEPKAAPDGRAIIKLHRP